MSMIRGHKKNSYTFKSYTEDENPRKQSESIRRIPSELLEPLKEELKRRSIADFQMERLNNSQFYTKGKDSGSMEGLNASAEERQNKMKFLRKFFNRRPTIESLKKKGIYKDEPVFGSTLEQLTKNRKPRIPGFVQRCIEIIEKEENMKADGLYRASGNLSQIQKIRLDVDQNNLRTMEEEEDVHVLTGSLKLFFRELKEPLIPFKQLKMALDACTSLSRKERIKDFQKIVKSLPEPNYDILRFLLQHLQKVIKYQEYNRMNINNLAIVFGPTLMRPEHESKDNMASDLMHQSRVVEYLLGDFDEIFT